MALTSENVVYIILLWYTQ